MNEMIEQYGLAERLSELLVGRRIVAATSDTLTLDDGREVQVEGSSDCCAWGDATFGDLADSRNVITGVRSEDDESDEKARIFVLTDAGTALNVDQEWNSSNGYYFYGLYLTVKEAAA